MIKIDVIKNGRLDSRYRYLFESLPKDKYDIKYINCKYSYPFELLTPLRRDVDIIWTGRPWDEYLLECFKPFVITVRGKFWQERPHLVGIANRLCQRASRIILLSNYGYNEFLNFMPNLKDKCIIIPNGIYVKDTEPINKITSIDGEDIQFRNDILITFVSNFSFKTKVQAAKELIRMFIKNLLLPQVKFVIAGNVSDKFFTADIPTDLRQKIIYVGRYDNILALLKRTDVFVYHTYQDMQPASVLEAGAMGVPVVATDNCGMGQWIKNGVTGFVCKNLDEMAEKIRLLIDKKSLRMKMGKENKKFMKKNFSWQKCANKYDKVFTEVVKKNENFSILSKTF